MTSENPIHQELKRLSESIKDFEWARHTDATVHKMIAEGYTLAEVIVALVKEKNEMADKAQKYFLIAPKKMKMADGSCVVWHCPDNLVPEAESFTPPMRDLLP